MQVSLAIAGSRVEQTPIGGSFGGGGLTLQGLKAATPQMFIQNRGPGYMTSRLAPAIFGDGVLTIYTTSHDRNGHEMMTLPSLDVQQALVPELAGQRGIVELDLWEDGTVHGVRLWLADGREVAAGSLVERIAAAKAVDYGAEPRRHRLIQYQRFGTSERGELQLVGGRFAYQPLCGCPCLQFNCDVP